jgi:16S rRNA (uracil1498-N3)-methyltransferase
MVRLYINTPLSLVSKHVELQKEQLHYLARVMRLRSGDRLAVFNEKDGEYWATFKNENGGGGAVLLEELRRPVDNSGFEVHLAFCPLKPHLTSLVVEKATELGVTHICLIATERTQFRSVNIDRLRKIAIEAAEQSERLTIPGFAGPVPFPEFLGVCGAGAYWLSAIERTNSAWITDECIMAEVLARKNVGIIIGPEGGFSAAEREALEKETVPISLGEQILRAETAAICALSGVRLMLAKQRILGG